MEDMLKNLDEALYALNRASGYWLDKAWDSYTEDDTDATDRAMTDPIFVEVRAIRDKVADLLTSIDPHRLEPEMAKVDTEDNMHAAGQCSICDAMRAEPLVNFPDARIVQ